MKVINSSHEREKKIYHTSRPRGRTTVTIIHLESRQAEGRLKVHAFTAHCTMPTIIPNAGSDPVRTYGLGIGHSKVINRTGLKHC